MNSSDFRQEARNKLTGEWGNVAVIMLVYAIISIIISFLGNILVSISDSLSELVDLIELVIEVPLAFGLIMSFLKIYNGEDVECFDFVTLGFNKFKRAWMVYLRVALKLIVPLILVIVLVAVLIVSMVSSAIFATYDSYSYTTDASDLYTNSFGIVSLICVILLIPTIIWLITKGLYYELADIIAIENENLSEEEAVLKSKELMEGNRTELFILQLSFIGWGILACCTFGIGLLWLTPYMEFSTIAFYKHVSGNLSKEPIIEYTNENNNTL